MGKDKLKKFEAIKNYHNVFEPVISFTERQDFEMKGVWGEKYFQNENPIILELGCGKGEYTVALSQKYQDKNFIGIDIKGARIWRGATTAVEKNIKNVAFLRTRVDLLDTYFAENEVSEIWLTFPDPQPVKQQKRLSSAFFLNLYREVLINNGVIHLKTDSKLLHFYTAKLLEFNKIIPNISTDNLYHSGINDDILSVRTHYEKIFMEKGKNITYLNFNLDKNVVIEEIERITDKDIKET